MKLTDLRTNHFKTPLGMHLEQPVFTWVTTETESKAQAAAQIVVTKNGRPVFDSGKREDISSLGFEADITLQPRTRYDWSVTVWGDGGDTATASSFFETAKEDEPWQARWIAADFADKSCQPMLVKSFTLPGGVKSARAYACGLGIYELEVNGKKAGDEYLLPGYHCYDSNLEYQTFDITESLTEGENTVGIHLAPGWYMGRLVYTSLQNVYGDTMQAICELHVTLEDGTEQVICTDESWQSYRSPVTFSNIYDGEHYDSTKEVHGWSAPGCKTAPVGGVVLTDETRPLIARLSPKIVKKQEFSPIELIRTPKNEIVLDFGQNMTGWVEFTAEEKAGQEIVISYSEVMQEGCFYNDNLRTAKAEYRYICDGDVRRVRPHFTFFGFRYVKIEGVTDVRRENFTACHLRSDIDRIGKIVTDDPRVNRLFENALWGQYDNFLDVPTDCPQRDERLGWTGDASAICSTACKNIYMPAFYHHFTHNVGLEEKLHGGVAPIFVPAPKNPRFPWLCRVLYNSQDFKTLPTEEALAKYPQIKERYDLLSEPDRKQLLEDLATEYGYFAMNTSGATIWSDVAAILPWTVYEHYGDKAQLRREYPVMKTWVERMRADDHKDGDCGLWLRGIHFGDWLALDRKDGDTQNPFGETDLTFIASAFYWYSTSLVAKAAGVLGLEEDRNEYEAQCERTRKAFIERFFTADGKLTVSETQTACVISLTFGLYPDGCEQTVIGTLKTLLEQNNYHLNTGFCGTPYLCLALSKHGANDLAYTLLLHEDYPSWLYEVKMGATTIWERWNSILPDGRISGTGMNSLNHYAYGSIIDWVYRCVCGIEPTGEVAGFKKAIICPMPDPRLRHANATLDTAAGHYECGWHYDGETISYHIVVPFDCTADVTLPDGRAVTLTAGEYDL